MKRILLTVVAVLPLLWILPSTPGGGGEVAAQERVYHPFYLPADHNWAFRDAYPMVDRLFNAFDYGHGILYETLWGRPEAPAELLEGEIYRDLTQRILPNPPRLPMPEASFMPRYARLVPLVKEMFEWAHILHRQSYDILADPRLSPEERDQAMAELLAHYRSSDLAFPVEPKGMAIMDEQYFSKTFRERYPRFNGLIWAYHWLQVAVYEPLLETDSPEVRQAGVNGTLIRFWQMLEDPPATLPSEMPMTPAIAPRFTERYPEFAAIFDNLHMMHDVISDILVSEAVAREETRREIYRQADLFRDPGYEAISREAWIAMALAHGVDAQGGPAVDWLPAVPTEAAEEGHDHGDHQPPPEPADHHHDHGPQEEPDALGTLASFHEALAAGDSASALGLLHPEGRVYEQGQPETIEEYRAHHLAADMAFARATHREVLHREVIAQEEGLLVILSRTRVHGTMGEREIDSEGVETAVLERGEEGWRIRHLHWSSR